MSKNFLPGFSELPKTSETRAKEYISSIRDKNIYKLHKDYFKGYLTKGYDVIMSHIRKAYLKYVTTGIWTEEKFDFILYVLVSNEQTLSNQAFINMGKEYDDGSIKYQKNFADARNNFLKTDLTDDTSEEDLLKFLNGGF